MKLIKKLYLPTNKYKIQTEVFYINFRYWRHIFLNLKNRLSNITGMHSAILS